VPTTDCYDYAVIRVVPRVERGEFANVGVVLSCPARDFLRARLHLDAARLRALFPDIDLPTVECHLQAIVQVCAGGAEAGPIGRLQARQRFHWLVAPRSSLIQTSAVHSGLCDDPALALDHLLQQMVVV
jgi:hypothetical protein